MGTVTCSPVRCATIIWRQRKEGDMNGLGTKITLLFAAGLLCAQAQWLTYPSRGTPRTKDGKPNLSAKAPRAANGKPDLSGVWLTEFAPPGENERLFGASMNDFVVPGDDPRMFS